MNAATQHAFVLERPTAAPKPAKPPSSHKIVTYSIAFDLRIGKSCAGREQTRVHAGYAIAANLRPADWNIGIGCQQDPDAAVGHCLSVRIPAYAIAGEDFTSNKTGAESLKALDTTRPSSIWLIINFSRHSS